MSSTLKPRTSSEPLDGWRLVLWLKFNGQLRSGEAEQIVGRLLNLDPAAVRRLVEQLSSDRYVEFSTLRPSGQVTRLEATIRGCKWALREATRRNLPASILVGRELSVVEAETMLWAELADTTARLASVKSQLDSIELAGSRGVGDDGTEPNEQLAGGVEGEADGRVGGEGSVRNGQVCEVEMEPHRSTATGNSDGDGSEVEVELDSGAVLSEHEAALLLYLLENGPIVDPTGWGQDVAAEAIGQSVAVAEAVILRLRSKKLVTCQGGASKLKKMSLRPAGEELAQRHRGRRVTA